MPPLAVSCGCSIVTSSFSHSACWLPLRKKLLYTVANPARGMMNMEKRRKEKVCQHPPPAPALLVGRKYSSGIIKTQGAYNRENKKNRWPEGHHVTHRQSYALRSRFVSRPHRAPSACRQLGQLVLLRRFYASVWLVGVRLEFLNSMYVWSRI